MQVDMYDVDKQRDLNKNREVKLEDGSKLFVRQKDPYGFWSIHPEKGKVPKELQGSFTDFDKAYKCILAYSGLRFNKRVVEINKGYVTTAGDNLTPIA